MAWCWVGQDTCFNSAAVSVMYFANLSINNDYFDPFQRLFPSIYSFKKRLWGDFSYHTPISVNVNRFSISA